MTKIVHGKVRGKTIEVVEELGLAEGQEVEIRVTPVRERTPGVCRSAGIMADIWTDEDDRILKEIYEDRKNDKRREITD